VTSVFADTSAFFALGCTADQAHRSAQKAWRSLRERDVELVTTAYVLVETISLLQRRLGLESVRSFREDVAPLVRVFWVDEELHERGLKLLLERGRRELSLVDAVSFAVCREEGIDEVFAFDRHFMDEGFSPVR
jgi:predicted nucleic acid-binding protein